MKIHPRLKPFHKTGNCKCKHVNYPCNNFCSCGPNNSCLKPQVKFGRIHPRTPCEYCNFWEGYGMKDWEIENMRTLLEIMENR